MAETAAVDTARLGRLLFVCLVCLSFTVAVGCGGKATKKKSGGGTAGGKLPAVDLDTALAVDDGRIAVASPTGWTRLPRTKDCLVKYQPGPKKTYPKILVTAEAAPPEFTEVTAENHQAFAAGIAEGVAAALGKAKPLKKSSAVKVGPHLGAFWGIPGSAKVDGISEPIERWSYAVVIGGRMYTVEARAPKGKIDEAAKAAAKAVAAALAPPSATTATEEAPADAAPDGEASPLDALTAPAPAADAPADAPAADAKPAEEKPAEEKPADAPIEDADK
ncbi:MAG: hypothetical protein ACKOB1_09190 [Planctomycetia bacterium]